MRRRSPGGVAASRLTASGITGKETAVNSLKKETAAAGKNGMRRRQTWRKGSNRVGGEAAAARAAAARGSGLWNKP